MKLLKRRKLDLILERDQQYKRKVKFKRNLQEVDPNEEFINVSTINDIFEFIKNKNNEINENILCYNLKLE